MPRSVSPRFGSYLVAAGLVGVVVGAVGAWALLSRPEPPPGPVSAEEPARQDVVHAMGHAVMPFALERTTHVFEMTATGGVQDVVADDPADGAQVALVRQHLAREAARFGAGDFSDPASLHGAVMPGLAELAAGAARLRVTYADLPAGGRITFATADAELVTAVHRWFGAQLSDHGADATYR